MPEITALYAGIMGLIAITLAFLAGSQRGKTGISIGDGDNKDLLLAMRRHGNFIEWVPMTLILLGLLELDGGAPRAIHVMGVALVVFRIAHAVGLKADSIQGIGRLIGAAGTTLVMAVLSVWNIVVYFQ